MEMQWRRLTKIILKRDKVEWRRLPGTKAYYKATVLQAEVFIKDKTITQQNRTESFELYPCKHGQLIFGTSTKKIQWGNK